jgi:hypothetical protein
MVAFNSSRRQMPQSLLADKPAPEVLAQLSRDGSLRAAAAGQAARRACGSVEVARDGQGQIARVRIGRWRLIAAAPHRRVAEVRELSCDRVAVKIERLTETGGRPSSEIWQLYDMDGRLEAAIQTTPDGKFAMLTNYRTRQACRLAANRQGELVTIESWSI